MDHAILWVASFTLYKLGTKNLPMATIFLKLVSKRRPEDIFNFKPCIVLNLVYVCQEDHYFHCFHNHSRFTDNVREVPESVPYVISIYETKRLELSNWRIETKQK